MKDLRSAMEIGDDLLDHVAGGKTDPYQTRRNSRKTPAGTEEGAGDGKTKEFDCPVCGCKHEFIIAKGNRGIGVGCNTQIEV